MRDEIRIALIGFGGMGQNYAKMINFGMVPGMKLVGVCCRNEPGQALLRDSFPGVALYRNLEEMKARADDYDAALIVTPHKTHVSIGMELAKLGKHLLMDKPVGISAGEVRELVELCEEKKLALGVIFNNRQLPAFRKAKEILSSGALGELHRAAWICNNWYRSPAYHASAAWRSSWNGECGGMLINQTPHNLDLWNWLFGQPDRVYAQLDFGRYNDFLVEDSADIQFAYDNGFHGTFVAATGEAPGVNRLEIWGSKGRLTVEDSARVTLDENEMDLEEFGKVNREQFGAVPHTLREVEMEPADNPYVRVFSNYVRHLTEGEPLYVDGRDGLKEVELANAIYVSGWEEVRVNLPVAEERFLSGLWARQEEERSR